MYYIFSYIEDEEKTKNTYIANKDERERSAKKCEKEKSPDQSSDHESGDKPKEDKSVNNGDQAEQNDPLNRLNEESSQRQAECRSCNEVLEFLMNCLFYKEAVYCCIFCACNYL